VSCLNPFNRITGEQRFNQFRKLHQSPPPSVLLVVPAAEAMCSNATNGREHIVDALGIGAVVLVRLSFLRRRRPVVIVPVNPSVL
jgi:hypothetical protein